MWTWIGAAVILGSSVFIARRETVAEEEEEAEGAPQKNVRMADTTS